MYFVILHNTEISLILSAPPPPPPQRRLLPCLGIIGHYKRLELSSSLPCHNIRKKRNERPNVGGIFLRSRKRAPSRKDAWSTVSGLRQATNECAPPSPPDPQYYDKEAYLLLLAMDSSE